MRAPATPELDFEKLLPMLIKQAIIWGPIVAGFVHQILMAFFDIDRIYVFVDPPEYIGPLASIAFQWWLVLLIGSAVIAILAYSDRLRGVPKRTALPFYAYILILLIFLKPV